MSYYKKRQRWCCCARKGVIKVCLKSALLRNEAERKAQQGQCFVTEAVKPVGTLHLIVGDPDVSALVACKKAWCEAECGRGVA